MHIFFSPSIAGNPHTLDEGESKHAVQVLRMKKGDTALLLDGSGGKYQAEILSPHPRKCELRVTLIETVAKRNFHLHLAIAPTKMNERMEWFLEKVTEIGVNEITPIISDRSERRLTNHDRFTKVIVTAMKQSMNPWLPVLNQQMSFDEFITKSPSGFIAHCMNSEKIALKDCDISQNRFDILIGPEGDFTEEEVNQAMQSGWKAVSLGSSRLRTETAGVVACHTINLLKS